uniref:Uncharacterized protein n=2 Tax=Pelusios castaneus TaxID=367368 RepID=A0A8C8SGD3_9SAUR
MRHFCTAKSSLAAELFLFQVPPAVLCCDWRLPSLGREQLSGIMHRSKPSLAERDPSRRWELARRDIKRAEARLSHGLQDLEEARHYHMNSMIREQRQIQKELLRLQQGNSRKKAHGMLGDISQEAGKRPALPILSPLSGQQHSDSRMERWRTPKSTLPRTEGLPWAAQLTLPYQTSDRDIMDGVGQESSGWNGSTCTCTQAKARSSISDLSLSDLRCSLAKHLSISAKAAQPEEPNSHRKWGEDPKGEAEVRDADVSDAMAKPSSYTDRWTPSLLREKLSFAADAHAPGTNRPGFLELYAEARKARYIRHKGIPDSEKELSLREIFGHESDLVSSSLGAEQKRHSP